MECQRDLKKKQFSSASAVSQQVTNFVALVGLNNEA
jgi:hypothetical protein